MLALVDEAGATSRFQEAMVANVVDDESFELVLVPDDGAGQPFGLLEEFSAQGSDPVFSEGVGYRCADGGLEDLEAFGSEDFVEAVDELRQRSRSNAWSLVMGGDVGDEPAGPPLWSMVVRQAKPAIRSLSPRSGTRL